MVVIPDRTTPPAPEAPEPALEPPLGKPTLSGQRVVILLLAGIAVFTVLAAWFIYVIVHALTSLPGR